MLVVALAVIAACWLGIIVIVFGCMLDGDPGNRHPGRVARVTRWVHGQGRRVRALSRRMLGKRRFDALARVLHYWAHERNPLMPSLYLSMSVTVIGIFVVSCWRYATPLRRLAFLALYSACMATFVRACRSRPAVITASNHKRLMRRYPFDGLMFRPGVVCRTCRFVKIARSKHCSRCNACVERFDHHCIWLNTCIGAGNVAPFLAFLVVHSVSLLYMSFEMYNTLQSITDHLGLFHRRMYNPQGRIIPNSYVNVARYLIGKFPEIVMSLMFSVPVAIALTVFTLFHLRLLALNRTTNEHAKLDDLRHHPGVDAEDVRAASVFYSRGGMWHNARQILFHT
ncbi:unnamed protein product (mitochondrion) [Plasmodiophora brassicae]|uniref:Palmitoyltransferase n=1 Tax=Plasmodiophora brassicae TaxID=37360 RepID=A0A0G4J674_PLABS|nr:hypothetical protein PBRA_002728 [Plasmodiophora brassicae]SPQ94880.1 unnamed protein product [Plasmodiophora brassicae]